MYIAKIGQSAAYLLFECIINTQFYLKRGFSSMRKTMSRRRVGQSDIELRLSCLAEQNFLNMPVFEGKAEQNRLYAAAQRERARRKKLLNLRFKRALVAVCMMLLLIGTGAGAYGSINRLQRSHIRGYRRVYRAGVCARLLPFALRYAGQICERKVFCLYFKQ